VFYFSAMEIIDIIIIVGVVLFVLPRLLRMLLPMIFQRVMNKAQQQAQGQQNYQQTRRPDGRVHVDYAPKTKSQIPDSEGDFIDYEEIK